MMQVTYVYEVDGLAHLTGGDEVRWSTWARLWRSWCYDMARTGR